MTYKSVFRSDLFAGQTAIVTGSGSGIGRCIAHEIAALGGHVVLIGRTRERLEETAAELAEDGGDSSIYPQDIRDEEGVTETIAKIVAERGRIHALVNNAGGQFSAPLTEISQNGFDTVVRNNLTGGFLMAREVYKQSMEAQGGNIVNVTADSRNGMPGMGHSGAARAGMENFTMTAAIEWAHSGVRVNSVAPGWVISSGFDKYDPETTKMFTLMHDWVPLKRLGTESEVSAVVCFLLSEGAAFITGETIRIDGGRPLSSVLWPVPDHDRSQPYEGFHRSVLPEVLKEGED